MARITWTGVGILALWMFLVPPVLGWIIGWPEDSTDVCLRLGWLYLATAAAGFLLGVGLNFRRGPNGRVWTTAHTLDGIPMQRAAVTIQGFLAVLAFAGALGQATGSVAAFLGSAAVVIGGFVGVPALVRMRQRAATTERRRPLTVRGWRVWDTDKELPRRWWQMQFWGSPLPGRDRLQRPPYQGCAYGVVGGQANGSEFTVFDALVFSPTGLSRAALTMWVVHLPVVLPGATVDDGRITAANLAFAHDLRATDLPADLAAAGFPSWRILGWDLVCTSSAREEEPDELVGVVGALTAAVARLPVVLLRTHGGQVLPGLSAVDQVLLQGQGALLRVPRPPAG